MDNFYLAQLVMIAAVLIASSIAKLATPSSVWRKTSIGSTLGVLSPVVVTSVRFLLSGLELAVAVIIFVPAVRTPAEIFALCVFTAGTFFVAWAWRNQPGRSCGCFGSGRAISLGTVLRSGLLAIAALLALTGAPKVEQPGPTSITIGVLELAVVTSIALNIWSEAARRYSLNRLRGIVTYAYAITRRSDSLHQRLLESDMWREAIESDPKLMTNGRVAHKWRRSQTYFWEYELKRDELPITGLATVQILNRNRSRAAILLIEEFQSPPRIIKGWRSVWRSNASPNVELVVDRVPSEFISDRTEEKEVVSGNASCAEDYQAV
jgi:hypothetical protein